MSRHHRTSLNKLEFEKSTRIDLTINKTAAREKQGERRAHFRASTKKVQFHHEYETHGIEKIGFATENNGSYRKGQIFRHDAKKLYRSTRIKIINGVIYVDDTALVFASRNEMIKALPLAQKLFSRFY
jgi:hypothetical protein